MIKRPQDRYPSVQLTDLPDDLRMRVLEIQERIGFIPNVLLSLGRRPAELRAFLAYHDALMLREGGLSPGDKEMIIVATSSVNGCVYCVVAHGAMLRLYEKNSIIADQVAINYRTADISNRQRAMLDFAMKVCRDSGAIGATDHAALEEHGFDAEDIWDIGAITGLFGLSNRMVHIAGMRANEEYYLLGR